MKREQLEFVLEDCKRNARSAWKRGVYDYALMLLENRYDVEDFHSTDLKEVLLNGARDWNQYSYGGCACIYDSDIAERLCTPYELKRRDYGRLRPNSREGWLDVQTRALFQAYNRIVRIVRAFENAQ
jgi:hypothetical protein